ncbi:hypothetical protein LTR95_005758 [Oleoguttula sp. CCFEE 5521]
MPQLQDLSSIVPLKLLQAAGVPSASIAVLSGGTVETHVITKGSEDVDTIYQACSISKAITGIAVARLIDKGRLTYDTPISDHLPAHILDLITTDKTESLLSAMTVGTIVSHTSGLSQGGFSGYDGQVPSVEQILAGTAPANTPQIHFNSFPGAQFAYSGGGWTVLQLFLEHLLSKRFAEIMQELVLGPLQMTRSHYGPFTEVEQNYAKAHLTGDVQARAPHHELPELAAAGLWTTPTDLLKAIAAVQTSLASEDGFLTRAAAQKLLAPIMDAGVGRGDIARGFFVTDTTFGHSGSNEPGYRTYFMGSRPFDNGSDAPPSDIGIAIFTNSGLGWEAMQKLLPAVFYLRGWPYQKEICCYAPVEAYVAYALPASLQSKDTNLAWKAWEGQWESGWQIGSAKEDDVERPTLAFRGLQAMSLLPGAGPIRSLKPGKEVLFVADGLDIGVRLTWNEEGERVVKLMQTGVGSELKTLHRSTR